MVDAKSEKLNQQVQATPAEQHAKATDRQAEAAPKAGEAEKLAEKQEKISEELRAGEVDPKVASLDEQFNENWLKQQRLAYPQLYREADKRPKNTGATTITAPVGLEPGHDPTASIELEKNAAKGAETAGSDNLAPHETTPAQPGRVRADEPNA